MQGRPIRPIPSCHFILRVVVGVVIVVTGVTRSGSAARFRLIRLAQAGAQYALNLYTCATD